MPTHERIKYKCGCYASGDNVSLWCPVHGLSGEFINVEAINSYFEQINKCQSCYELQQRLATVEAERDELQRHCESYKSAYDAILADLRIMEQKLNDLQVENSRLIRIGEERHIRAKDTEEGLMEHVERLQEENERLRKALEKIVSYCSDRHRVMMLGVQGFSTINEIAKAALREVDGGKD